MNFIERDDDQSLLNPGVFELRERKKTRQFIDWNSIGTNTTAEAEQLPARYSDGDDDDEEYWDAAEDEDDYGFEMDDQGFYFTRVDVPADLLGLVIGKGGESRRRIERTSNCTLVMPRRNSELPVVVRARSQASVDRGRTQVELSIEGKRFNKAPGYFLAFSLAVDSVQRGYGEFKRRLTEKYAHLNERLFQPEKRLHLTIGMLYLLGGGEVEKAKALLDKCRTRVNNLIADFEVSEASFEIEGIETMNDDPYMTDVIYAKVTDPGELLQAITQDTIEQFIEADIAKKEHDRVKLHCTIMNSKLVMDEKTGKRKSFDAAGFMRDEQFAEFKFGRVTIDSIQLHKRNIVDGAYEVVHQIRF